MTTKRPDHDAHRRAAFPVASSVQDLAFLDDEHLAMSQIGVGHQIVALPSGTVVAAAKHPGWALVRVPGEGFLVNGGVLGRDGTRADDGARDFRWNDLLAVSADRQYLARLDGYDTLVVERRLDATEVVRLTLRKGVESAAFLPDGRLIAVRKGQPLIVVHPTTGTVEHVRTVRPDGGKLEPSPDGAWLALYDGHKQRFSVVSTSDWREVASFKRTRSVCRVAWGPDGTWMAVAEQSVLAFVDAARWEVEGELALGTRGVDKVAISPSGELAAIAPLGEPAEISVWSVAGLRALARAQPTKRKPPTKPKKHVLGVFFAVAPSVPAASLADAARDLHYILDNAPDTFVMLIERDDAAHDLRWFTFLATPAPGRVYRRDPWVESLLVSLEQPLTVACVDERNRVCRVARHQLGAREPVSNAIDKALLDRLRGLRAAGEQVFVRRSGQHDIDALVPRCNVREDDP